MSKTSYEKVIQMNKRIPSLFSRKIKCFYCGSGFKLKKERSVNRYICSSYDNKGECIRIPIQEDFLVELIQKRLNREVNRQLVEDYVELILVEETNLVEIFIKDQESILLSRTHLRF